MSRAAALDARKGEQKAAIALKAAEKAADQAIGLTSTMAKVIKADELICTVCGATKLGPIEKCICPGGRSKPGPDFCPKRLLLQAAKARVGQVKDAERLEAAKKQGTVAGSRSKKREGAGAVDLQAECQGDGTEMQVTGEPAQELGVQAGWVIFSVGGELAPQDTSQVTKLVMRMFKEKKDDIAGLVDFKFRVPIVDGFVHCIQCDKFVDEGEVESSQRALGPGKQMCQGCEEIACMGF